jgi:soluble lytic murein transglycosylase-like protein
MPRVPIYANPQVQDAGVPGVRQSSVASGALLGAGAAQEQQLGAALTNAGTVGLQQQRLADQRANQLRVDDAMNQAQEKVLTYTFDPAQGYLSQKGAAALNRPNGTPLTDEFTGKLQGDIDSIAGSLGNAEQQRLFKLQANNLVTQFRGQTMKWTADQQNEYGMSVRQGTIANQVDTATRFYNDPTKVDGALQSIDASAIDLAHMQGKSAEEAIAFSRQQTSKAVMGAINGAMQVDDFGAAVSYLRRHSEKMTSDDLLRASDVLERQAETQLGTATATKIMGGAASGIAPAPIDRLANLAGAGGTVAPASLISAVAQTESGNRDINADGSLVTSPAGAKGRMQVMDSTNTDPGFGVVPARDDSPAERARVGRDYLGAMLQKYNGNLTMALAAYNAGPGSVDSAMAKAKDAKDPNWMQFLPKPEETIPYVRNVQNRYAAGDGAPPKPTLQDLQQQARAQVGDNNPRLLKITMENLAQQYDVANKAVKQREDESVAGAMRALEQNGGRWSDLPLDIRATVPPDKVDTLLSYGSRLAKGDDITNPAVYQRLSDPTTLNSLSDSQFYALRSELSQSDWQTFSKQRGAATVESDKLNTSAINQVLNNRLATVGMDPTPKDDTTDAQRVGAIRKFINDGVLSQQRVIGKQMTDAEVERFIDGQFAKTDVIHNAVFPDSSGRRLTMKPGDIPGPVKTRIKNDFKAAGIADPSDADVLGAYWRALQAQDTNQSQRSQWFMNNTRNLNGN